MNRDNINKTIFWSLLYIVLYSIDALPLDQCFEIIADGCGRDFDPFITEAFLDMKEKITDIVNK